MPIELIVTIAAVVVSLLVFTWFLKVFKSTFGTALKIALIALALQVFFGIGPQVLWQWMMELVQQVWK